ncbi:MAG: tetratricopeptide repeat protein [Candidatus Fermentibacteraceae bacterium]|nr:tetratricopeptide repeat protein [Candidatus Fermentibacteraceae bacterium]MBN2608437.1 tetratricopeptide repeat protein [Candidatus Fermentibacteraceae bacterium]
MPQDFSSFLKKRLVQHTLPDDHEIPDRSELRPGERRDIAVLFLDLGGFTALSERLDHEAVHDISKGVMDALVDITEKYGGYVDKIEGDRIMVLFGARKSGENDSERAVSCALLMLSAIGTANEILSDTGVPITARIGINSGPVTVAPDAIGHLTAIGRTVNLASRMEEAALENTILLPDTVREKCLELFHWEDIGFVDLKGISRPVHAFRPTERVSYSTPRWERLSRVNFAGFVGRERELGALKELMNRQMSRDTGRNRLGGSRHIVVEVKGEAGIGKSRLVHEFILDSIDDDPSALVLQGQTLSYAQPAYHLWVGILRGLLKVDPSCRLEYRELSRRIIEFTDDDDLSDSLPFLAELLSIRSGDRRLSDLDSSAIALETRIAFRNLLKALASGRRLIVVLDDLQWIDSTCRGVLEFVTGNCATDIPILFILISRFERDDGRPVKFDIKPGYAQLEELTVSTMEEEDCRGIITRMLSGICEEETVRVSERTESFLLRQSQGNPFFLEELVLELVESGLLQLKDGEWSFSRSIDDIYVPSSLTGLLQSRLDRLPEDQRGSLQKSSVLGFEFRLSLYSSLLDQLGIRENTAAVFSSLERRQFLLDKGALKERAYEFRHILIHDTVYSTILASNRKVLHRLTARLIEEGLEGDDRETAELLTHHWEMAGDREKAIRWGMVSLGQTVATYQHERALELSDKLETWILEKPLDKGSVSCLLEVMLGRQSTLDILGRRREQEELLVSMKELADSWDVPEWKARIQSSLGSIYRMTGRMDEAEACYRTALESARETGREGFQGKVLCNLGILSRIRGDLEGAGRYFHDALEKNQESGDPRVEGVILGNLGNFYFDQGLLEKSVEYYQRALALTREVGDRRSEGIALGNLGNPLIDIGEVDQALDHYRQALRLHREIGNRRSEGITLVNLGVLYYERDRFEEARECYEKALEINVETGNRRVEAITLASLALLRVRSGDRSGALEYFTEAFSMIETLGLSAGGFEHFDELRVQLLSAGFTEEQVPWPSGWPRRSP